MLQEQEWLHLLEVVKKESYPVYGEDFEDTISENYLYCIQIILAERKHPGRRRKITAEFIRIAGQERAILDSNVIKIAEINSCAFYF